MKIRKLIETDREPYQKLCRYAWESTKNNYEKIEILDKDQPLEWFYGAFTDDDEMMAGALSHNLSINIRGTVFKTGGIAAVTTKPEYRNRGAIRKILQFMHQDLRDSQVPIAVLYPFKHSYYENFGYKLVDEYIYYQFEFTNILRKELPEPRHFKEVYEVTDEIKELYQQFTKKYNYMCNRTEIQWKWRGGSPNSGFKYVCYTADGNPVGYLFLYFYKNDFESRRIHKPGETIAAYEFVFLDTITKQAMLNFLWAHRDQRKYMDLGLPVAMPMMEYLKSPRIIRRVIVSNSMARILDVAKVLREISYSLEEFTLNLQVNDANCEWNNQTFTLEKQDNRIQVTEKAAAEPDLTIDIKYLTQLVIGFKTITDLVNHDFAIVKSDEMKHLIAQLFPKQNNFLHDFF